MPGRKKLNLMLALNFELFWACALLNANVRGCVAAHNKSEIVNH
jgi:hypothetical protein